mgnify:CR=1 FL=1
MIALIDSKKRRAMAIAVNGNVPRIRNYLNASGINAQNQKENYINETS